MSTRRPGETNCIGYKLPKTQEDWQAKRRAVDLVMKDIGGVVIRVGDETIGEMWSLYDGQNVLREVDPRFAENIERHIFTALRSDTFHVSGNTDPKGDRSKRPQDQDPDMLLHLVKETDAGIIVRGAKYETAAAYANQAFVKPTIANWGDDKLSDYALGFICDMGAKGLKHICRTGFAGRAPARDYPLVQPLRRGRHAAHLRRCADPLGERAVLSPYPGGELHPRHAASLQRLSLRPAHPLHRRHDDRRGAVQRAPDRPRPAAGGAREAGGAGDLSRDHQRPSDRRRSRWPRRARRAC